MSSRRGEYGYRDGSVQFPRRSSRERQAIYMSLDENFLLSNSTGDSLLRSLVDRANRSRNPINSSYMLPHTFRYSTRSKDRIYVDTYGVPTNGQSDVDDDFEDCMMHSKIRKKSRSKPSSPVDDEVNYPASDSAAEDSRPVLANSLAASDTKQEIVEPNMYEGVKQRRQAKKQATLVAQKKAKNAVACNSLRRRQPKKEDSEGGDEDRTNDAPEDDDETDDNEPRHYALRTHINPVARFCVEPRAQTTRTYTVRRELLNNDLGGSRSRRYTHRKSLFGRNNSSSTSSESSTEANEDTRFQCHRLRRMKKSRAQLRPVNSDDLSYTIGVRELIRRKAGAANISGSDIDPMHIDRSIDFSKIGGLDCHIQSLKEVVLFPLLYGEIFSQFSIQPPKGVLFYGPPGTGKTLVARALANSCSHGDKKVAFFMRKGADILSKWIGESERQLRALFEQAFVMRPSIIFFDEIDGLAPVRSSKQDQIHSSIVSTLLALMDGLDSRCEVFFSLPHKNARLEILKIHTSSWGINRPSDNIFKWLSERTSGYCGADLKSLCTEAVLTALRSQFPQIYSSKEKVCIDPKALKVEKKDFDIAMRRIVPAGRRDFTIPSRILDDRLKILLEHVIAVICHRIPKGYHDVIDNDRELDGLPEERFSHCVQSAIRASSSGTPCLLLIPSIDRWYSSVPSSVWNLLLSAVSSFTGFTSIFLLSTAECSYSELPAEIQLVFRSQDSMEITPPPADRLEAYFRHVIVEPASDEYPPLAKADMVQPSNQLSSDEIKELKKLYDQYHLEVILHYEETIARLIRDRRFSAFVQPVDPVDVPDYYTHIKSPMDLGTMFSKASSYKTPDEFLNDFRLIHQNAVEYNPMTDYEGRQIRLMAKLLLDMGQRAVLELDSKFLKRLEDVKRMLKENGIMVGDDDRGKQLSGYVANNCEVHMKGGQVETNIPKDLKKTGIKRRGLHTYKLSRKRRCIKKSLRKCRTSHPNLSSQIEGIDIENSVLSEGDQLVTDDDKDFENGQYINAISSNSNREIGTIKESKRNLKIDLNKLDAVVHMAVNKSRGWPLVDLELFAAKISEIVETFRDKWDRTQLPYEIDGMIRNWSSSE
ncbi:ATPase, AAA family protein [Brugia malayi]|uniref:ATPase, AAA family protein n=1 Tax=Brugia malayi TaxID=6279 RepID=A0A1P6BX92_BRUMA|nr:ATPase, AAA family protein [Brugia malayi]CDP91342.1 BMA-LEX-1, isoform g [Brugia malayi]VIO87646.1 ATPase, AAA family protein [Brugia malayi]